ncbi:MAG TPA: radical SAM family heme chaperone HemW [Candidatus Hydrogenedentes bacterium]|nr:radical SAM family heme chaperone HemW [Candidatus Hydrogenedentota bacterium]HPG67266.1 radical SAM family heme chaperone HemW [Candidatus Hydrogenedentota bacterium]
MLGIYIHIPFCRTKCPYCDFVSTPIPGAPPPPFVDALCSEIRAFDGSSAIRSVFIGGGTPSILAPRDLARILDTVRRRFRPVDAEISIEANPDDVSPGLLDAWRDAGINRVSLGVQSFDDAVLRYLGRRHDAAAACRACEAVAERFSHWAMDLIFGAPPVDAWPETLRQCLTFAPPHVSTYGLTYEPATPMGARAAEAVDDALWLDLYRRAEHELADYDHYEISNFARPGFECRHNLIYWHNEEYAGFGPAAYSFIDGVRAKNPDRLDAYLEAPGRKAETLRLDDWEIRVETAIQHCRLRAGLNKDAYHRRFGTNLDDDFGPALEALVQRGLVENASESIRPTRLGFELNDEIGLELLGRRP